MSPKREGHHSLAAHQRQNRGFIGCDAAQFQSFDSSDFSVGYLQYVDDDEVTVVSCEQLASMADVPGLHLLKERWWTNCCSLIERTGRPVVTTVRSISGTLSSGWTFRAARQRWRSPSKGIHNQLSPSGKDAPAGKLPSATAREGRSPQRGLAGARQVRVRDRAW